METADELDSDMNAEPKGDADARIQPAGYLLELSLDWIVLRASENIHRLLDESHVTLIDEPLGKFVHAQALHDLRNLFSRLSATTGIARAYAVRLTDDNELVDVAFQLSDGRVLLEAVPSAGGFGEHFGSVAGLAAGLADARGQALLEGGARRMRALTGYDRVTLTLGDQRAESVRGAFEEAASASGDLPAIVTDTDAPGIALFPRRQRDTSAAQALMASCDPGAIEQLRREGVRASLRIPWSAGETVGEFRCDCRSPHEVSFELHAAAELFAELFAMRLELDRLKEG